MSRIGKNPVTIPDGVSVEINGQEVKAKGPKGELSVTVHDEISAEMQDGQVVVAMRTNSRLAKALWATTRSLINNICIGVKDGYTKNLEIKGVGYRAALKGKELVLNLGFSHEVVYPVPEGITMNVDKNVNISIAGIDKQQVGQVAAEIIRFRPPEPYKGKGIRYEGQHVMLKEGKKK